VNGFQLSDRLHPMIVKELRQGLRSRGYLILHMGLQALLVLVMLMYIFEKINMLPGAFAEQVFYSLLAGLLLVAMPLLAFFSGIRSEQKGNTYELLICTHMRPGDIQRGKWLTRMLQALLLLSSMIPYVVVRYLLGQVELIQDLLHVFVLFVYSSLLISLANRMFSVFSMQRSIGIIFLFKTLPPVKRYPSHRHGRAASRHY